VAQYDHDDVVNQAGLSAICGGFVYRGSAVPSLVGQYLFGDLVVGRIFHVPAASLQLGSQATVHELTLVCGKQTVTLFDLVGTSSVDGRVDLRFGEDEAGEMYVMTKQDGVVRRIVTA
jgi:hypothetical protein